MESILDHHRLLFDRTFNQFVSNSWGELDYSLHQAIRYALLSPGKRVRPMFAMLVCEAFGADSRFALSAAVAVEMVHAYSLAHDDLPSMDNDDWRRGRPSLHKAFDEATALLSGDSLLADAFRVLSDDTFFPDTGFLSNDFRIRQISELSAAAGGHGMALGQSLDMYWTKRSGYNREILNKIHMTKTGALLGAACAMGAIASGANRAEAEALRRFGILIGLAFQAVDDTLDSSTATGKSMDKDMNQGKLTYLTIAGRKTVLDIARDVSREAIKLLPTHIQSDFLIRYSESLIYRSK